MFRIYSFEIRITKTNRKKFPITALQFHRQRFRSRASSCSHSSDHTDSCERAARRGVTGLKKMRLGKSNDFAPCLLSIGEELMPTSHYLQLQYSSLTRTPQGKEKVSKLLEKMQSISCWFQRDDKEDANNRSSARTRTEVIAVPIRTSCWTQSDSSTLRPISNWFPI
jgi:hypothetical protein